MGTVRTTAKKLYETVAVATGLDRLGCRLRRGRATVLAYHNVVPDEAPPEGDLSLHLPVRTFCRQLDALCRLGRVVALADVLEGTPEMSPEDKAFAITFDDAYRGAVALAVPELERRGLPATIFVAPALLGDQTLWWDGLGTLAETRVPDLRDRILTEGKGTLAEARRLARKHDLQLRTMPEYSRSATEAELVGAARVVGITIGSHTWSHASLVQLSDEGLSSEVARPREWLASRFPDAYLDVLSYPYGFHSATVREAARAAGYRAGFALSPGAVRLGNTLPTDDGVFRLPRLNVPGGLSPSGLRIKAAWA